MRNYFSLVIQLWPKIPNAVAAIDGTSHRIYRPLIEDQREFYSGYRGMHCFHTMVVISNDFKVVMAKGGYTGRHNDAGIYQLMRRHVHLPRNLYALGDLAFPNGHPLLTPYHRNQLNAVRNTPLHYRRLAINRTIRRYRPRVENAIKYLKDFYILHYMFRHSRQKQAKIVTIVAALTNRRLQMFEELL